MRSREFITENPIVKGFLRLGGRALRAADTGSGVGNTARNLSRKPPYTWTPDRVEQLKLLWDQGKSRAEIAQAFGLDIQSISNKVRNLGLEPRSVKWTPDRSEELKLLWDKNYSAEEIAQLMGTTVNSIQKQVNRLQLRGRDRAAVRLQTQGYRPFSGKTFTEFFRLTSFKLVARNAPQMLEWLDREFLPTPQGQQFFQRLVAFDTKMLKANHVRGQENNIVNNRDIYYRYNKYKWDAVDEVSTIDSSELTELQREYQQLMGELRNLFQYNFNLQKRLGQSGSGFGFISKGSWPSTSKADTYENWLRTQKLVAPDFLDQMQQFEDKVDELVIAKGVVTSPSYPMSIKTKIRKLGDPPDLVSKYRELQTKFTDIRIKAGADFDRLRSQLPAWQLAELNAVDLFRNLKNFQSADNKVWNIDHVGADPNKIDIHFFVNNKVVGGAEVKRSWNASFGGVNLPISIDNRTSKVIVGAPKNNTTVLANVAQELLANKLDYEMLNSIVADLNNEKTGRRFSIALTKTIDVSEYVKDYYSKKDNGSATFLAVGDEIFKLADEIPEALRNFPGMNRMRGIEGMQGKLVLSSHINSRGKIRHTVLIRGVKQEINSIKLADLK